jgi:putative transposase
MVASRESAALAEVLISQTCAKQHIGRDQLTIHADRGSSMTSKPVAFLLADLGVTQSHSRPHVSNDNPFSEAQFKTLKYRPDFPTRFPSILDRGRPGALPGVLLLVQRGTSPHRAGPVHRCRRPPRPGRRRPHPTRRRSEHRLRRTPRTVRPPAPQPPKIPVVSWINPPEQREAAAQLITARRCLNQV